MGRATARFTAEIQGSHHVYGYVEVVAPSGETVRLTTLDGQVSVDSTASYQRAATVLAVDPTGTLLPSGNGGILTPLGSEVRLYRGVIYNYNPQLSIDDQDTEVYPLGVFRLSQNAISETLGTAGGSYGLGGGGANNQAVGSVNSGGVQYALQMFDRSRTVSRNAFTQTYSIPAGTSVVAAIKNIIALSFPNLNYDVLGVNSTTPAVLVFNSSSDPWQACQTLAQSIGCNIYFDVDGDVVIAPPTDISNLSSPSYTYIEGSGNTLTQLQAVYTDSPGYNGVIVTGASVSSTDPPVQATAWDTEPSSPTYYLGPYGKVPQFVSDNTITTVAQAQASADSLLAGTLGFSAQISATSTCNPALEVGDIVEFKRASLNVSGLYVIQAFTVPLRNYETQSLTLRSSRTIGS